MLTSRRNYPRSALPLLALLATVVVAAMSAAAQDANELWQQVVQPPFDPAKTATVENVTLSRDRIRITLVSGTIQFTQAAVVTGREAPLVFGAVFKGSGRLEVQPPNPLEAQQLSLFIGKEALSMEFTDGVFTFTDATYEELAAQLNWSPSSESLGARYADRQQDREDVGAELVPRIFKSLLSGDRKRTALFLADVKTTEKGWLLASYDAIQLEEVTVGQWTQWGGVRLFDTWMSFPAGGRSATQAYQDPLARENFLIPGYKIDAEVTSKADFTATTRVHLESRVADERVLLFEFDSNLRVESVRTENGAELPFFQPRDPKNRNQSYGDYLAVVLPEPTRAGQAITLEVRYGGKRVIRQVGDGNYFCQSYGWYPTRPTSFATRADFEMSFRNPKKFQMVATATKLTDVVEGDLRITTWKTDIPIAVAGFAFGDYKVESQKVGDIDVEIYANRNPDDLLKFFGMLVNSPTLPIIDNSGTGWIEGAVGQLNPAALIKTMATEFANNVRLFEAYFGPYPFKRLAVTNIPYSYGQGWPTLIYLSALSFLDSTQRNTLGIGDQVELTDFFRAHETSHQWWGHRVGWKSYHDQWLSEGFAEFSGLLYVQLRKGDAEYLTRLRLEREDILGGRDRRNRPYASLGPVWMGLRLSSSDAPRGYSEVVYKKGGLILHMIRRMMWDPQNKNPDHRFMAMMQDFTRTFDNRAASTEDFKAVLEKHMIPAMDLEGNGKMDWFFRQYVYGTGMAEYRLYYDLNPEGNQWKLSGRIVQSGVPEGWKDAMPIYLQLSGNKMSRLGVVPVTQRETPFNVTLPMRPQKVLLNVYEDVLAHFPR